MIATESVSSGFSAGTLRSSLSNRVEYCERDRSDLYMTVRPPGVERKSSHGIHTQSRKPKEERGEPVMYNKKYSMDSDYRFGKWTVWNTFIYPNLLENITEIDHEESF